VVKHRSSKQPVRGLKRWVRAKGTRFSSKRWVGRLKGLGRGEGRGMGVHYPHLSCVFFSNVFYFEFFYFFVFFFNILFSNYLSFFKSFLNFIIILLIKKKLRLV
jgi:hypothetical protein